MFCEEERQQLIAELFAAQEVQKGDCFNHKDKWMEWWQKQGGDIVMGLHDLVFGEGACEPIEPSTMKGRFIQLNDGFNPATTCGLCGQPLNQTEA